MATLDVNGWAVVRFKRRKQPTINRCLTTEIREKKCSPDPQKWMTKAQIKFDSVSPSPQQMDRSS